MGNTPPPKASDVRQRNLDSDQLKIQHLIEDISLGPENHGMTTSQLRHLIRKRHPDIAWQKIPGRKEAAVKFIVDLENIPRRHGHVDSTRQQQIIKALNHQLKHVHLQQQNLDKQDDKIQVLLQKIHPNVMVQYDAIMQKLNKTQHELNMYKMQIEKLSHMLYTCKEQVQVCKDQVPWEFCMANQDNAQLCFKKMTEKYPDIVPLSTSSMELLNVDVPQANVKKIRIKEGEVKLTTKKKPARDVYVKLPDYEARTKLLATRLQNLENIIKTNVEKN